MKTELDTRARGIDAKRVEAMAEGKGVEGTLKEGRGPVYRQRMDELNKLQAAYKIQEDRVKDAKKRLDATDGRIAQIRHELAVDRRRPRALQGRAGDRRATHPDGSDGGCRRGVGPRRRRPGAPRLRGGAQRVPPGADAGASRRVAAALLAAVERHAFRRRRARQDGLESTATPSRRARLPPRCSRCARASRRSRPTAPAATSSPRTRPPTACSRSR